MLALYVEMAPAPAWRELTFHDGGHPAKPNPVAKAARSPLPSARATSKSHPQRRPTRAHAYADLLARTAAADPQTRSARHNSPATPHQASASPSPLQARAARDSPKRFTSSSSHGQTPPTAPLNPNSRAKTATGHTGTRAHSDSAAKTFHHGGRALRLSGKHMSAHRPFVTRRRLTF